jgi:hypothetical protein
MRDEFTRFLNRSEPSLLGGHEINGLAWRRHAATRR